MLWQEILHKEASWPNFLRSWFLFGELQSWKSPALSSTVLRASVDDVTGDSFFLGGGVGSKMCTSQLRSSIQAVTNTILPLTHIIHLRCLCDLLISRMVTWRKIKIFQIQDGGGTLYWKSFFGYVSASYCPINMKFGGVRRQNHTHRHTQ